MNQFKHTHLRRQLERFNLTLESLSPNLIEFLNEVDQTYTDYDDERQRSEHSMALSSKELMQANEELRAVFQVIPDIFLRIDSEGIILDCRGGDRIDFPKYETLPNVVQAPNDDSIRINLVGRKIQDGPDDNVSLLFEHAVNQVAKKRALLTIEYSLNTSDGKRFYEARFFPSGKDESIVSIRNITGRKSAEMEILKQKTFFSQVIDLNPNFIYAKDRDGRFTLANRAIADAYGTTPENMIGKMDSDFGVSRGENYLNDIRDVFDHQQTKSSPEEQFTDSNGMHRFLQSFKRPLISSDGKVMQMLVVSNDITFRKIAEEENELLSKQLLQSQKLQAIGTLAGGVAHDFNNLLSSITGFSSLMRFTLTHDSLTPAAIEELSSYLDLIDQAAMRGAKMIKQILGFSRQGKINVKTTETIGLIQEVIKLIQHTIDRRIKIETDFTPEYSIIDADESQIVQVLMNLSVNAVDAMMENLPEKHEGKLKYRVDVVDNETIPPALPRKNRAKRYVRVSISDTGIGIQEELKSRVFEPFFTTKPPDKGSGLGLAMSYGIVKNHNGFIWLESKVNEGTEFSLFFPQSENINAVDLQIHPNPLPQIGKGRILVVDDEPALRLLLTRGLGKLGYQVISASNGQEGVLMYNDHASEIDAIILDMNMPIMNGMDAYKAIRSIKSDMKILFVTGHLSDANAEILKDELNTVITTKPYAIGDISSLLEKLLQM
ncbi:MAG: ATP-binding protein [Chloroherpetonaceae bacterium]|nr:ATP-binding protein [Chloroherpetonaceae bacterium]